MMTRSSGRLGHSVCGIAAGTCSQGSGSSGVHWDLEFLEFSTQGVVCTRSISGEFWFCFCGKLFVQLRIKHFRSMPEKEERNTSKDTKENRIE